MADDLDDDVESGPEDLGVLDEDEALEEDEVLVDEVFADDDFSDDGDDEDEDDEEESAPVVEVDPKATTGPAKGGKAKATATADDEDGSDDDDDEPDPDDVEADLDTILKDRLVVAEEEDDEEEEPPEPEDRGEGGKVRPRAPGEFVCRSCFLVKHPSQLADERLLLCRDCV